MGGDRRSRLEHARRLRLGQHSGRGAVVCAAVRASIVIRDGMRGASLCRSDWRSLMTNEPVPTPQANVAVVGVGYWGKNLVRNFYDLGALSVLCDAQGSVETTCRTQYERVRFCRDYREVLTDPSIGAVALATPAVTHYEMARAALEAGKDVMVEKPLAIDVRHGAALVELAKANGRILMVGHILRYHQAILKLQELIASGALGK